MSAAEWPRPHPEGAYVREEGVIFYREDEEEPFASDILSRHPDCLAEPMAREYARLYVAHGEEKAEAYLKAISDQLGSMPLGSSATDEEIRFFARRLADQFLRLQRLITNPAIAARFLGHLAQSKYRVTPPWGKTIKAKPLSAKPLSLPVTGPVRKALPSVSVSVTVTDRQPLVTVTGKSNPYFPVTDTDTGDIGTLARLADE